MSRSDRSLLAVAGGVAVRLKSLLGNLTGLAAAPPVDDELSVAGEAVESGEFEVEELDEASEPEGWASATPGRPATADPTPSATANAPTRPT
ncbi:MAG TPA: hypothetical protein VH496_11400 [Mycobacterium sp.]